MSKKILVVDDESRIRKLIRDFLTKDGYVVEEAQDGEEALDKFYADKDIDLILLDVMMPKIDGWQVCQEIRQSSNIPIIMLTARAEERDELHGFGAGADDYIAKPFSPKILVARIGTLLKRTGDSDEIVEISGITLNKVAHSAQVDGQEIYLSFKEFELLSFFLDNPGVALSRDRILNAVWDYDYFGDARTIDTHVKKLRSKMGEKGNLIKTIWGMGYKFEPQG